VPGRRAFTAGDDWTIADDALALLGFKVDPDLRELRRDKEVRLNWDRNVVHLFFSDDAPRRH
jgi:hypothetical protein